MILNVRMIFQARAANMPGLWSEDWRSNTEVMIRFFLNSMYCLLLSFTAGISITIRNGIS